MTSATTAATSTTPDAETISNRFFIGAFATLAAGILMSLGIFGVVAYHGSLAQTGSIVTTH